MGGGMERSVLLFPLLYTLSRRPCERDRRAVSAGSSRGDGVSGGGNGGDDEEGICGSTEF